MPNAFDRRRLPGNDKDPNRVLDFKTDVGDAAFNAGDLIRNSITGAIYDLTGIDLSSWEAFLASLNDGVGIDIPFLAEFLALFGGAFEELFGDILSFNIPGAIGHLLELLGDALGLGLGSLRSALENFASMFGIDLEAMASETFDTIDAIGLFIENILDQIIDGIESATGLNLDIVHGWFDGLSESGTLIEQLFDAVTGRGPSGSAWNDFTKWALSLIPFGGAGAALPTIGSGQVGSGVANLFLNPLFDTVSSFIPGLGVLWSSLKPSGAKGSAQFNLDGTQKMLFSNGITAKPGEQIKVGIETFWQNVTGSGPLQVIMTAYDAFGVVINEASQVVASVVPGLNSSGWVPLSATYTVPQPGAIGGKQVAEVAARFNAPASLTGGVAHWSKGLLAKINPVPVGAVGSPLDILGNLDDWGALLFDTIGGRAQATITDLNTRLNAFLHPASPLNGSNISTGNVADNFVSGVTNTIENIVTKLFGWLPGGNYTHAQAGQALGSQAGSVLGTAQQVNQLAAYIASQPWTDAGQGGTPPSGGGGATGASYASTLTSLAGFSLSYPSGTGSHTYGVPSGSNGQAAWTASGNYSKREAMLQWGQQTLSDYQRIACVIGTYAPDAKPPNYYGWNHLYGRGENVKLSMRGDGYWELRIGGNNFGAVIASGQTNPLGVGSTLLLICGNRQANNPNYVQASLGFGNALFDGAVNLSGGSRGGGFGSTIDGAGSPFFGGTVAYGGSVNDWSMQDVLI